jgi:hypothetical protein
MATVTAFTAARSKQIEDNAITGGSVVNGQLILTRHSGQDPVNAGNVRGPKGDQGDPGEITLAQLEWVVDNLPKGILGHSQNTADVWSPTTQSDLCTVSVSLQSSRRIKITAFAISRADAPPETFTGRFYIYRDNVQLNLVGIHHVTDNVVDLATISGHVLDSPGSGSFVYKLRAGSNQAGQHSLRGASESPTRLLVEDLGPI